VLAKVNHTSDDDRKVMVTKLDIDDLGSVVPVKELELCLPANDDSVVQTIKNSDYVAVFTDSRDEEDGDTIILARGISTEELNREKEKTIEKVNL
jgi:hypothetical protein